MGIAAMAPLVVWLITITATIILVSRDWRVSISAMGAQYVGVLILVALSWPLELAVIKLIAGWIAMAVLGISLIEHPQNSENETDYRVSGILFRIFTAGMMGLAMLSLVPTVAEWAVHADFEQILGSMILMSFGLLHLGFTAQPDRIILGLLTIISGFEIIYSTMETSLLVNAFLAVISFGIALIGAYLIIISKVESEI